MRNYFSTYLLWAAKDFARLAKAIEANHDGDSRFDIGHRARVVAAVVSAASFLEAAVNEIYQDAADGHGVSGDGHIAPLSPRTRELMSEWWAAVGDRSALLDKYQLLLVFAGKAKMDPGASPFQDAWFLISLRNALVHYKPESVAADVDHRFTKSLRGKFSDNALMSGAGNPWWPDHALGAGCAEWAFRSAKALADAVCDAVGVSPNYRRHEATWFAEP